MWIRMSKFKSSEVIQNLLILTSFIVLFYLFTGMNTTEAVYIKSDLNNKEYFVQNTTEREEAAYILSIIDNKIGLFKNYLNKNVNNYPQFKPYIDQFCSRVNKMVIYENSTSGNYTSYTVNKGEELVLCLRSKKTGQLHDINLITYVVLHELTHIACPEIDHTPLFTEIFKFFVKIAVDIKIYTYVNYQLDPKEYCGISIHEHLLKNH